MPGCMLHTITQYVVLPSSDSYHRNVMGASRNPWRVPSGPSGSPPPPAGYWL